MCIRDRTIKAKYEQKGLMVPATLLVLSMIAFMVSVWFFCHRTDSAGFLGCLMDLLSFWLLLPADNCAVLHFVSSHYPITKKPATWAGFPETRLNLVVSHVEKRGYKRASLRRASWEVKRQLTEVALALRVLIFVSTSRRRWSLSGMRCQAHIGQHSQLDFGNV